MAEKIPRVRRLAPHEQRSRGPRGDGPCPRQARRARRADLLERERPSARRPGVLPGIRAADENYEDVLKRMSKKPIEYFRMFYGDTVLGGSASALRCGLDFFGADRVVFASDCPFDPEGGPMFIREGIRSVEDLKLPEADKRKIYFGNAMKLLRMPLEQKK